MEWNKIEHDSVTGISTGFPTFDGKYIFCFKDGSINIDTLIHNIDNLYGAFLAHGSIHEVTAWMELPKPYKG